MDTGDQSSWNVVCSVLMQSVEAVEIVLGECLTVSDMPSSDAIAVDSYHGKHH